MEFLKNLPQYAALITSCVAILLFIIKESIEIFRKKRANRTRLVSLCVLFLERIRINNLTVDYIKSIVDELTGDGCSSWTVEFVGSGDIIIGISHNNNTRYNFISQFEKDIFNKAISELASLDADLFNKTKDLLIEIDEANLQLKKMIILLLKNTSNNKGIMNRLKGIDSYLDNSFVPVIKSVEVACLEYGKKQ